MDKAIDAVPELLELLVDRLVDAINDNEFDFDRDELDNPPRAPRRLPGRQHRPRGRVGSLPVLAGFMFDVVDTFLPEETAGWRDAMAVLLTDLGCRSTGAAGRRGVRVGLGRRLRWSDRAAMAFDMGPAPTFVLGAV